MTLISRDLQKLLFFLKKKKIFFNGTIILTFLLSLLPV